MEQPLNRNSIIVPVATPGLTLPRVGTDPVEVVGVNLARVRITFANPGSNTLYIAPLAAGASPALAVGKGIPILPTDSLTFLAIGNFQINCAFQAVAGSDNNILTIVEDPPSIPVGAEQALLLEDGQPLLLEDGEPLELE